MRQALCTACVLATIGVIGSMALPGPLPAASNLRTVTMWWVIFESTGLLPGRRTGELHWDGFNQHRSRTGTGVGGRATGAPRGAGHPESLHSR